MTTPLALGGKSTASDGTNLKIRVAVVTIGVLACQVGFLFIPGGVVEHYQLFVTTGCDHGRVTTSLTYSQENGTGTVALKFCGDAPDRITTGSNGSINMDRAAQIYLGLIFIALSLFGTLCVGVVIARRRSVMVRVGLFIAVLYGLGWVFAVAMSGTVS